MFELLFSGRRGKEVVDAAKRIRKRYEEHSWELWFFFSHRTSLQLRKDGGWGVCNWRSLGCVLVVCGFIAYLFIYSFESFDAL